MTATIQECAERTVAEGAYMDKKRLTHIVNCPPEYETTQGYLMAAMVEGFEVEALCGHVWLPTRDPKKYPVCQSCIDEAMRIQGEVFGQ